MDVNRRSEVSLRAEPGPDGEFYSLNVPHGRRSRCIGTVTRSRGGWRWKLALETGRGPVSEGGEEKTLEAAAGRQADTLAAVSPERYRRRS